MVSLLIRLLALLGLFWTGKQVLNQVSSAFHPRENVDEKSPESEITGTMVKDPVCQTYIPKAMAIQKNVNDETYYFCSEECMAKFFDQRENDRVE